MFFKTSKLNKRGGVEQTGEGGGGGGGGILEDLIAEVGAKEILFDMFMLK